MTVLSNKDPLEYIRMACEVHLGTAPNRDTVEILMHTSSCLFVYLETPNDLAAKVSDALPEKYLAAVAFMGGPIGAAANSTTIAVEGSDPSTTTSTSTTSKQPLQCVTLQPTILEDEDTPDAGGESKDGDGHNAAERVTPTDAVAAVNSQAALLQALQLYSRNLFLPSLKDQAVLQEKIRQLNVAIGQSQRSAKLPTVTLNVDSQIVSAASNVTDTKANVDWNALGLAHLLQDDDFLNALQSGVSNWIVQIRKLTVLPKSTAFPLLDDADNTALAADLEELSFWNSLSQELQHVQQQLSSPPVQLTLAMLREAKRFVATLALQNNTGLEPALSYTQDVQHFLKAYPATEYPAARDFETLSDITNQVFDHLPKIRSSRYYGLERLAQLLSATTLTLRRSVEHILHDSYSNLLFMEYKDYETKVRYPTQDIFVQFDDRYQEFREFFLEQARRRKISTPAKILDQQLILYHKPLEARLDQIHEFRSSHERLRQVVLQVLQQDSADDADEQQQQTAGAIQTVENAPRLLFSALDLIDLSPGGTKALESALEEYDMQMDAMEERLAKLLRDKLTACQDAEDMFRVFARFNPLLSRTRVRVAVKEFQVQLIATVAQAVEKLQSKFTLKYEASSAAKISKLRGIPPVSGKILWAKQMERQVNALMERCAQVLGPDFAAQLEGRQLRKSGDELLAKLDARAFFQTWVTEWEKELTLQATSRLHSYPVTVEKDVRSGELVPTVNFNEMSETLPKEIQQLRWLGFEKDIPRSVMAASEEATKRYPFAIAIKTALRSYQAVRGLVTSDLEPLLMPQLLAVRETISEAFDVKLDTSTAIAKKRRIRWDAPRELSDWVGRLSESVTKLEERVEQLLITCDKVDNAVNLLGKIDYDSNKFRTVMDNIQRYIDEMSLGGYPQLATWVQVLDERLAKVLAGRLTTALENWNHTFRTMEENKDGEDVEEKQNEGTTVAIHIPSVSVEILLRNQEISSVPAVPTARSLFFNRLHDFIGIVCNLQRPKSGRYEVFDDAAKSGSKSEDTFDCLVGMVPAETVSTAYARVEECVAEMSAFVDQWLAYQTLWDTQVADVAASVGNDIEKWQKLLLESAEARSAVDLSSTSTDFGAVTVKYSKVQSQITLKYDSWQKELQSSFASILGQCIRDAHGKMEDAKTKLESATLETSSGTESIVLGVTFIQEMKQNVDLWAVELDQLESSERLVKRQRFNFGNDWMETTVVKGQFELVKQVLGRRIHSMEQQFPLLQARVSAEEKSAAKRSAELVSEWAKDKPLRGNVPPADALTVLAKFETDLNKAKTHQENLIKAKDALGLEHTAESSALLECLEELADLKSVWEAVSKPHDQLQEIKDTNWSSAVMRKIRRALDDLLAEMRSLPNRIRQYEAFNTLHDEVKGYIAGHSLLADLKTEALKERHWKTILKQLGISLSYSELTIGVLWEKGVLNRKKEIGEILTVAQGERALEMFLSQVKDRWTKQELQLVLFQQRVRLIRGWDDLFANLDDHIGGLALMKSSPYYRQVREFQEEGSLWEERLTKLRAAFDSWIDVQRRWVYLEGILFGSSDIKAQLPSEWSRFKSVDSEFVALMRRIAARPYAMEVLNIESLQRTLERLGNLMSVIQKALGEYLEKQRREFSRFYFLGDDDLLEIMGNASEPGKVLSHVSKMFAGIASARLSTEKLPEDTIAILDAMVSKDGEVVPFHEPIKIMHGTSVKVWLKEMESKMKNTLAMLLESAVSEDNVDTTDKEVFVEWATKFPAQIMILATQINWSMGVDKALGDADSSASLKKLLSSLEWKLEVMAETVLKELPPDSRKKFEQMITELVHQRDVVRDLIKDCVSSQKDFRWLYHLRYTYHPEAPKLTEKLMISLSNATFYYGFEYLGIGERLVQTPLTDKAYLTLTQALHFKLGGSPFGPAGTGKTETVKALGAQLGRFVLVFNCDEKFDFSAMGRLFCGLCQVGAWGCFDEFNRLEEGILSAVSQQILGIQQGLLDNSSHIDLLGRSIRLDPNMATFITMNPGYAGRSNLPDNLKTLFRSVAMVTPDRKLIAQVMLYSQGIVTAEQLAPSVVDLFLLCEERMTKQRHYDFGLRALKTLLVSAGALKRKAIEGKDDMDLATEERNALIVGACNNILPKLIAQDILVFKEILEEVFPGSAISSMEDEILRAEMVKICEEKGLVADEGFIQKILQLKQVIEMRHGIMVVGKSGVGKSVALKVLMESMHNVDGIKGDMYYIDPKAISKDDLYGSLDGTTLEWTDGIFTNVLRKILDNQKGESDRRHWIVFDGDVDPDWAENLNSVLDDNKMLTLPSGERLTIPPNMRIILEVDSLEYATPATVSRCGMVFFNENTISSEMSLHHLMSTLEKEDTTGGGETPAAQILFLQSIRPLVVSDRTSSLVIDGLDFAMNQDHIMVAGRDRFLNTLKALLLQGIGQAIAYDENHPDFPMSGEHMEKFAKRWLLHSLMWSFAGSASWEVRKKFGDMLLRTSGIQLPSSEYSLVDYRVRVEDGEYELWSNSVPRMEIESHRVSATDLVITTTDTVRHSDILGAWLNSRTPVILCGPPGSGKTMTLTSVLQSMQGVVLVNLNFSSRTTPDIILKVFQQYCKYVRRGKEIYLEPAESLGTDVWLVIFSDEINLPENDSYGTQRVIMFMRQLVEQGGFWRDDNVWIKTNRIQFVGACNPPTDAGRVELSHRFLRHAPLLLVDFPETDSLMQIYRTFNGGMLKLFPSLRGEALPMTEAMIQVYTENQRKFTASQQPQYIYSPRELSRWVRGIYEAIAQMDTGLSKEELCRIWTHEGLRLFCDRLVEEDDRKWCHNMIDDVARKWFAGVDFDVALKRPLFYTTWLSKETRKVEREELKEFLAARLRVFYEEMLDVKLVVFDEVLEHILRIDRVLRQPMGHLLLCGDAGAGKTVLTKFVSWMNGLNVFQIKAHSKYGINDFYEDLREVMKRVALKGEKITFIFDEANCLKSAFIEAMNALLASGEVPGLFEGDEYTALINACRDSAMKEGVILDSEEELWRRFTTLVQRNLHVVFTMNPSGGDWKNRSTTSPALFNRCVVDWFGTWGSKAMGEVGKEFTLRLDMGDLGGFSYGMGGGEVLMQRVAELFEGNNGLRQAVVAALVELHLIAKETADDAASQPSSVNRTFLCPRDYLTLIQNFVACLNKRRGEIEDQQLHVNAGLHKLQQTQENVAELKKSLGEKTVVLKEKEAEANNKLQSMVANQNIAEKRKEEAERMSAEVQKQQVEINRRKDEAQRDLDEAEPALRSAQASVRGIKKRDLDEVKALARPPENVKLTLECVSIMLGESSSAPSWADVRKLLAKSDFIPNILNFDADKLSTKQIKLVRDKYLDGNPDLTTEAVMRSSKACGPLFSWAESQVRYSTVYNRIQPLRDEVEQLEQEASVVKEKLETVESEVKTLETSIAQYKADYATLIRDVEALKSEMEKVTSKVDRAESLLKSLGHESERWKKSAESFEAILRSLVGDSLLLGSFLTYSGFFDFKNRQVMMDRWKHTLQVLSIEYHEDLGIVESLSTGKQRVLWQSEGLPNDTLSLENGVILDHAVRFPLVIDPSGSAIHFLMQKHETDKIQKTSFLDKAFVKTLAGAVRFGTALLVENVEHIDPILNPLLNKELQRTGGRVLVRIGTEDIDYSPNFKIILSTKTPRQSLSKVLQYEKPELEIKRAAVLKLQGEQNVKLRELEDQMLAKISACEGSILEDDQVVAGMEVLMKEGQAVEEQISQSDQVMAQVHSAVGEFEPFASICRKVFVLLGALREISFLYEFSSNAFMATLEHVLEANKDIPSGEAALQRLAKLKSSLFTEVVARVARGLKSNDKVVFSVLLARIFTSDNSLGSKQYDTTEDYVSEFTKVFGDCFLWEGRDDLHAVVSEVDAAVPLLICSAPGYDVSSRVEGMAKELGKELSSVAMGSAEGFDTAESLVTSASKRGTWVMLKNVHLCTDWLNETFVKKLQTFGHSTHKDFRLFVTSEISPKLPTALLRLSDVTVAEASSGIKPSMARFISGLTKSRLEKSPIKNRLYLLVAWIHAVLEERVRYGWPYELAESDSFNALKVIDELVGDGMRNPDEIPFDALSTTMKVDIFGSKVSKEDVQGTIDGMIDDIFTKKAFDLQFPLVPSVKEGPTLPDSCTSQSEMLSWISSLPSTTPPTWVGLADDAEEALDKAMAEDIHDKICKVFASATTSQ
ncbi:dynein family protein [Nitzschia inconspicua]|uniref:Dynein heavy chain, cytoplasmic n=1 Tax=Nitzschia inconspicua TaxID=303405 RepID=A0A9K3L278_9STRA|nr:dynein family protein [Nitzschia inconspicua]